MMDKPPMDAWFRSKQHQINRIAISSEPEWLLVLKIHKDGSFSEEYNGPANWLGALRENAEKWSAPYFSGKTAATSNKSPAI